MSTTTRRMDWREMERLGAAIASGREGCSLCESDDVHLEGDELDLAGRRCVMTTCRACGHIDLYGANILHGPAGRAGDGDA